MANHINPPAGAAKDLSNNDAVELIKAIQHLLWFSPSIPGGWDPDKQWNCEADLSQISEWLEAHELKPTYAPDGGPYHEDKEVGPATVKFILVQGRHYNDRTAPIKSLCFNVNQITSLRDGDTAGTLHLRIENMTYVLPVNHPGQRSVEELMKHLSA